MLNEVSIPLCDFVSLISSKIWKKLHETNLKIKFEYEYSHLFIYKTMHAASAFRISVKSNYFHITENAGM